MSSADARLVDFAQGRVNRIADAIDGLAESIKLTNNHVERLNREVGEVASLRLETPAGFARVDNKLGDIRSKVILQARSSAHNSRQRRPCCASTTRPRRRASGSPRCASIVVASGSRGIPAVGRTPRRGSESARQSRRVPASRDRAMRRD